MGISLALWVSVRIRWYVSVSGHLWGMMGLHRQELVGLIMDPEGQCGGRGVRGACGCPSLLIGLCHDQKGVKKQIGAREVCRHLWGLGLGQGFSGSVGLGGCGVWPSSPADWDWGSWGARWRLSVGRVSSARQSGSRPCA